jgi:hypothetical protein
MKDFIFKILTKYFGKQLRQQVEEWYLEEQLPTYKITLKDINTLEKLSDLWKSPEFKIWLGMQANRKNHLGRAALAIKYQNESDGVIKNSYLQGQAFNISLERTFLKHIHSKFQTKKTKKGRKTKGK